jgi:hypothetical protein
MRIVLIINIGISMATTFALERTVHFPIPHEAGFAGTPFGEQRTGLYIRYCPGVAQAKNVLGAKSTLQTQALLGLGKCGA